MYNNFVGFSRQEVRLKTVFISWAVMPHSFSSYKPRKEVVTMGKQIFRILILTIIFLIVFTIKVR